MYYIISVVLISLSRSDTLDLLDLKVTILGFGYHVTCQHVPELAGMR